MKRLIYIVLFVHLGLAHLSWADQIDNDIKKIIISNKLDTSDLTMEVNSKEKNIFSLNAEKQLIPASVTKLMTAYTVLRRIPLDHKFKTELFFDGKNVFVKGGGDPGFVSENMWYLVNEFKRQKINSIPGDIILDDTYFDQVRYDESRQSQRVDRSYDAPVSALSFNWNSVNIYIKPVGTQVEAYIDPESNYFSLVNRAKVISKGEGEIIIHINQKERKIIVSGELSNKAAEKAYFKNVPDPISWFGENFRSFLKQRNIEVKGKIKSGKVPTALKAIATVESKTLSQILSDMNKFSNNYVAEMLTKNIAALSGEQPATLKTGVELIKSELKQVGIKESDLTLENPSGFSRNNRFSAKTLNLVLNRVHSDFKIFPTFTESLPLLGIDGTLKKRMKNTDIAGYVRAKTGYLDGVVSLAGYLGDKKSNQYTFSFIYNGNRDEAVVRSTFDEILRYLQEKM